MESTKAKSKALGLCSGGLDSILSALVLRDQDIYVEWITFTTPFFSAEKAKKASRITGIPLTTRNITQPYMQMLKNPRCGYGQHMNPCLDCHALMFRLASETMKQKGFDFMFSGEVVGQRPMSQTKPSLRYVEKHSGMDGYILRPLSAKNLPETIPEKLGLVDRNQLLDLSGRSRKPQMALAKKYGITDYPSPAGGCLLTDKLFSIRLRDLLEKNPDPTESQLHLLRYGRHLRLDAHTKVIVGRTRGENEKILNYFDPQTDTLMKVKNYPGPTLIIPETGNPDQHPLAASICVRYSKAPSHIRVNVMVATPEGKKEITIQAIDRDKLGPFLIADQ